jgi:hypothetical protein
MKQFSKGGVMKIDRRIILAGAVALMLVVFSFGPAHRSLVVAKVHAQSGCSLRTLKGSYGFFRTGATPVGPLAAVGIDIFDGKGSSTFRQTTRKNGDSTSDLFDDPPLAGTYDLGPDCTGTLSLDGDVIAHMVVVDGGKGIFILSLSTGNSVYGEMRKIEADSDQD